MATKPVTDPIPYWLIWAILIGSLSSGCFMAYCRAEVGIVPYVEPIPTPAIEPKPIEPAKPAKQDKSILAQTGAASTAGPGQDHGAGTPQRTLRQSIKGVIYSMDGCGPCERLLADCKVVLPAAKWTLGEAKDFADACAGECDFYHVHQPSGKETFDSYPTFAVYRNGMMIKRWWGPMTAKNCAERWLEVYNMQLEARAK